MIARRVVCFGFALALAGLMLGSTSVITQENGVFYVVGYVKSPGQYRLQPDMTVGTAIDVAGGLMPRGFTNLEIIRTVNGEKQVVPVTLDDEVRAHDTISVK